jgi:hypothetical protein
MGLRRNSGVPKRNNYQSEKLRPVRPVLRSEAIDKQQLAAFALMLISFGNPFAPCVRMSRLTDARRDPGAIDHRHRCRCRLVLRAIETELEELREQNRLLLASAGFFAELSERLNVQLLRQKAQPRLDPGPVRDAVSGFACDDLLLLSRHRPENVQDKVRSDRRRA